MNTPLDKVRELILSYDFSEIDFNKTFHPWDERKTYYDNFRHIYKPFTEVTNKILFESFKYFIDIKEKKETSTKLGYSKEGGYPHLPKDWELPSDWENFYFLTQLNISDFKHLDLENLFPKKGIIYVFQHLEEGNCRVYFYEGEEDGLVERHDIKYMLENVTTLTFEAHYSFFLKGENSDGKDIYKLISKDLRQSIENELNCNVAENSSSRGICGIPVFWQGEDENCNNENVIDEISDEILLYQTEVEDISIHLWIKKIDLRSGYFDRVCETFSGT